MRAYPRYRDSGVEWIGEVPEHWQVSNIARAARYIQTGTTPPTTMDEYYEDGTVPWFGPSSFRGALVLRDPTKLLNELAIRDGVARHFEAGTVMVTTIASVGKVGVVTTRASCNQQVTGVTFDEHLALPTFAGFQMSLLESVLKEVAPATTLPILSQSQIGHLTLALPPLDEQRAIAAYLDRETERIEALVAKKRLLIERLEEYRTALITRTVTRGLPPEAARAAGLDPSPRLKPSGVEWLGDVPEHWEVQRLRDCSLIQTGPFGSQLHADEYTSGGIPIVNPANIVNGRVVPDDEATITPAKADELSRHAFRAGDLAFGRRGEMARVALLVPSDLPALCGTGCLRVDPSRERAEPSFLLLALGLGALRDWLELVAVGSTLANLNEQIVGRIPVALPPPSEQRAIAAFLGEETARIDGLSAEVETAIERLQEYRTALITAAVTGKIDVRE